MTNRNKQLFTGQKFQFRTPDSFNHENEIRKFQIISEDNQKYSIIYNNNDCSCKDGWIKWVKCLDYPLTEKKLKLFLINQYNKSILKDFKLL